VITCTDLIGRSRELERVEQLLAAATQGRGGGLFLLGEPGVGKSRLIDEAARIAVERGIRAARAACLALTTPLPLDPVLALARALGLGFASPANGSSRELFWMLVERLEQATVSGTVLLCLDDVQWSDAATMDFVHYCLARLRDVPLVWLLAARSGRSQARIAYRLERDGLLEPLELSTLSGAETRQLAEATLGPRELSEDMLAVVYERTDGNAFLCLEVLRALTSSGAAEREQSASVELLVPASVRSAIEDRADALSPAASVTLEWAALLPEPFGIDELMAVSGAELESGPEELVDGGFLIGGADGRWSFVHALIRDAVYGRFSEAERVRRHGIVADALAGGPLERLAPQLERAHRWREAADTYARLGESALVVGQGEDAAGLFERSEQLADLSHDRPSVRRARAGRVYALLVAGAGEQAHTVATELREELRAGADSDERLRFLVRYATTAITVRDATDVELVGDALAEAEPLLEHADAAVLAEALATRAWAALRVSEHRRGLADAEAARALLVADVEPELEARVLNVTGLAIGLVRSATEGIETLERAAKQALQARLPSEAARAFVNLGYLYELTGDLDAMLVQIRRGLAIEGTPAAISATLHGNLAYHEAFRGNLDAALAHGLASLRLAERCRIDTQARFARGLGFIHVWRGELSATRRLLEQYKLTARDPRDADATELCGLLLEEEGAISDAFEQYVQGMTPNGPTAIECARGVARTAVELRDVPAARAALARIDELSGRWPMGEWMRTEACGWVAVGEGRIEDAIAQFRAAQTGSPRVYDAARMRLEAARLSGDRAELRAAVDAFEQMGALRAADRGRAIGRSLGIRLGRHRAPAGVLSPREREVAQLVAAGRTNDEIATSLFLSPRTVEHHVSNILTKLHFRSRIQIATEAAAGRLPGATLAGSNRRPG
jgi:DNA-binding CsgD family transcriptional regulator